MNGIGDHDGFSPEPLERVEPLALLLVEDSPADSRLLQAHLREAIERGEVMLQIASTLSAAEAALARMEFSAVLVDLGLPDGQGVAAIEALRVVDPNVALVVLTGNDNDEMAHDSMQLGVQDYVIKGRDDAGLLLRRIRFAVQRSRRLAGLGDGRHRSFVEASHDAGTGLPNRELFIDRAAGALAQAERTGIGIGILRIRIDGCDGLSDGSGRPLAETVCRRAGALLADTVRKSDTIARLDSSDLIMVLVPTEANFDPATAARRVHQTLSRIDCEPARLAFSVGVAVFPRHGATLETLIDNSEHAMYRARRAGGGVMIWDSRTTVADHGAKPVAAGAALVLRPLYQPWVDVSELRYAGVEVVLAAADAEALAQALPEVRRDGYFDLIASVCEQLRAWRSDGLALPMLAINLDTGIIEQPDLLSFLRTRLEASGLAAEDLRFEVPAKIFEDGTSEQIGRLRELQDFGFAIVIDQFLTSADGIGALATMPVDALKLCREVLSALPTGRIGGSMQRAVTATLGAARALAVEVIASGVDTAAMQQTLRTLGCRHLQGDSLCPPLTAAALPPRWRAGPNL